MVSILLNGEERKIPLGSTVATLLAELELVSSAVAVEINRQLVPRARHSEYSLSAGDQVEVVTFKGGG